MPLRGGTVDEPGPVGAQTPVPTPVEQPEPVAVSTPAEPEEMVSVLAPIDAAEIEVEDAAGVEYFVKVTSGLPNGCVRSGGYAVTREGDTVLVEVTNLVPANKELMCAMVYGTVEGRIPLPAGDGGTVRYAGANGRLTLRADSGFYTPRRDRACHPRPQARCGVEPSPSGRFAPTPPGWRYR